MRYKIYVGNYPLRFNEEDVLNLFQDYDGVELAGFFRNKQKCYSFLYCMNKRQLIEIVTNLHDIDVCGRNLIVRAAEENLQKQIQKPISENGAVNFQPRNTSNTSSSTLGYENSGTYASSEGKFSRQTSHFAETNLRAVKEKVGNNYCQNVSECENSVLSINPQETFSKFSKPKTDTSAHYKTINERFDSYKTKSLHNRENTSSIRYQTANVNEQYKPSSRHSSESSLGTVPKIPPSQQFEKLNIISVMNFPLHLPVRNLYELFDDFNPIKVFMVCNEPRKDKTPTEALICFEHEKEATEAILTLDNTVYQGRILLVTDAVDKSMVTELLTFR